MSVDRNTECPYGCEAYELKLPELDWMANEDDIPIDLTGATEWEKQEIIRHWRETVRCAEKLFELGRHYHRMLIDDQDNKFRYSGGLGTLDAGGDFQPVYMATKFVTEATKLEGVIGGMTHRLAIERRRADEEARAEEIAAEREKNDRLREETQRDLARRQGKEAPA